MPLSLEVCKAKGKGQDEGQRVAVAVDPRTVACSKWLAKLDAEGQASCGDLTEFALKKIGDLLEAHGYSLLTVKWEFPLSSSVLKDHVDPVTY